MEVHERLRVRVTVKTALITDMNEYFLVFMYIMFPLFLKLSNKCPFGKHFSQKNVPLKLLICK